jgi:DNA repair exonuclease SbcCD nuclease subunit
MGVRFIHTADWQIGKPFANAPGDAGAFFRKQRFKTVNKIAQLATEQYVDAVLVAGDVFETNAVEDRTILETLEAMRHYTGPWILLPGNHDAALAESVWTRLDSFGFPPNIIVARSEEPILLAHNRFVVLPAPLMRRHETRDLTEGWSQIITPPGVIRVGLAHGSVENRLPGESESINTIAEDRAVEAKLNYLALGDWHGTVEIGSRTWYSGTPEPDRFKDNDSGNVLIVTIENPDSSPHVERVPIAYYSWHKLASQLLSSDDISVLEKHLANLGDPFDRQVVSLSISGTVDFRAREILNRTLKLWEARFAWFSVDDGSLVAKATADDLDRVDTGGFVRVAIEKLRTIEADTSHPDHVNANYALQLLYLEHVNVEERT